MLPGGDIVVTEGLLKILESENELSFVLGHELGHFYHRDVITAYGRGIGLALLDQVLHVNILGSIVTQTVGMSFNRSQESDADDFGLEVLNKVYGHLGGAKEFFQAFSIASSLGGSIPSFLSTHPSDQDRISRIDARLKTASVQPTIRANYDKFPTPICSRLN